MPKTKTPREVTVNLEQGLFVIPEGSGYSCLGFDVCRHRTQRLATWLARIRQGNLAAYPAPNAEVSRITEEALTQVPHVEGNTLEAYQRYAALQEAARQVCESLNIRCTAELVPALTPYLGKWVRITYRNGQTAEGKISRSTGWTPVYLLVEDGDDCGDAIIESHGDWEIVKVEELSGPELRESKAASRKRRRDGVPQ